MSLIGRNLINWTPEEISDLSVDELSVYNVETLKFKIVPSGFDLNKQNSQGKTLMHFYVETLKPTHIKWLLYYGANKEILDHFDKVPIDYLNTLDIVRDVQMRKYRRIRQLLPIEKRDPSPSLPTTTTPCPPP